MSLRALPSRPRPPGVDEIAAAIDDRLDEITRRTVADIAEEIPVYVSRGTHVTDDVGRAATLVYRSFLDSLRTGRPPNESAARSLASVGADRAQQGIPLSDLLHAFRISARTMADALVELLESGDVPEPSSAALLWVAEAIVLWVDVISNLAASDYTRTQARMVSESEARRRAFLLNVLYGGIGGASAIERASDVGWDPASEYFVAVAGSLDGSEAPEAAWDDFLTDIDRAFVAGSLGDLIVLAPTGSRFHELEVVAADIAGRHGLVVGFAEPRSGVEGVRRAYLEACDALGIARARATTSVRFEDAILDRMLLRDTELLSELFDRTIAPLVEYDEKRGTELIETLETYLREGESPTRVAQVLHTHPQTIRYRLNRINEISGLAVDQSDARLELQLGLRARALLSARGRRESDHSESL